MSYLTPELPPISIRMCDADRLRNIAEAASDKYPQTTEFLAREIDRAEILTDAHSLPGLVTMESDVTFRDDISLAGTIRDAGLSGGGRRGRRKDLDPDTDRRGTDWPVGGTDHRIPDARRALAVADRPQGDQPADHTAL
jgi:hypothetical protein